MNPDVINSPHLTKEEKQEYQRKMDLLTLAASPAPLTLAQLAELMGVSGERVRQLEARAIHKCKIKLTQPTKPTTTNP